MTQEASNIRRVARYLCFAHQLLDLVQVLFNTVHRRCEHLERLKFGHGNLLLNGRCCKPVPDSCSIRRVVLSDEQKLNSVRVEKPVYDSDAACDPTRPSFVATFDA